MSGYWLILVILLLGGALATLGDRLGFKVGKLKLSVWGLRPKDTASVAAFVTGMVIAGVTVGTILLVDGKVREGLFQLDALKADLEDARSQKQAIRTELATTQQQRIKAEAQLEQLQQQLNLTKTKEQSAKRNQLLAQQKLVTLQGQVTVMQQRSRATTRQATQAQSQVVQARRNLSHAQILVAKLKKQELNLRQQQNQLLASNQNLGKSLDLSRRELSRLDTRNQELIAGVVDLRERSVIITAKEVLATGLMRGGLSLTQHRTLLENLLAGAELEARKRGSVTYEKTNRAVLIYPKEVDRILDLLAQNPQQEKIIQIRAALNVLKDEPVLTYGTVITNAILFDRGEIMASREIALPQDPEKLTTVFAQLLQQASTRARSEGILPSGDGKIGSFPADPEAYSQLLASLQKYHGSVVVQAVTADSIYTSGPLMLSILVLQNGKVLAQAT